MKISKNKNGYVLAQVLIESVIVLALIAAFFAVIAGFGASGRREDMKQRVLIANMSALEMIRQVYRETGSIVDIADINLDDDGYETQITSLESVVFGEASFYRIAVDTRYKGNAVKGMELVTYVPVR